jgi:hypothetical protein
VYEGRRDGRGRRPQVAPTRRVPRGQRRRTPSGSAGPAASRGGGGRMALRCRPPDRLRACGGRARLQERPVPARSPQRDGEQDGGPVHPGRVVFTCQRAGRQAVSCQAGARQVALGTPTAEAVGEGVPGARESLPCACTLARSSGGPREGLRRAVFASGEHRGRPKSRRRGRSGAFCCHTASSAHSVRSAGAAPRGGGRLWSVSADAGTWPARVSVWPCAEEASDELGSFRNRRGGAGGGGAPLSGVAATARVRTLRVSPEATGGGFRATQRTRRETGGRPWLAHALAPSEEDGASTRSERRGRPEPSRPAAGCCALLYSGIACSFGSFRRSGPQRRRWPLVGVGRRRNVACKGLRIALCGRAF